MCFKLLILWVAIIDLNQEVSKLKVKHGALDPAAYIFFFAGKTIRSKRRLTSLTHGCTQ